MKARTLILALGLLLLLPSSAFAYKFLCDGWEITGVSGYCPTGIVRPDRDCNCNVQTAPKWRSGAINFRVESQGGNGISSSQFIQAAQSAMEQWSNVSCSSLLLSYGGALPVTSAARWGGNANNSSNEHAVFFVTSPQEWMEVTGSGAGNTLGVTVSPYNGWNCNNREISDTDILSNGFIDQGWTYYTVQETLLHEMGHSVGLGHPCLTTDGYCNNSCSAVMAATGANFNIPQQDDATGVCALYTGVSGGLGSACSGDWDCTSGPCITHEDFTYCSQACGSCPTGYACKPVNGQNVCVRKGLPGVGEPCVNVCVSGAICLGGDDGGTCYVECNPYGNGSECPTNNSCVELEIEGSTARGICLEAAGPGMSCEDTNGVCVDGYVCVGGDGGGSLCRQECNPNGADTCAQGYRCMGLSGQNGQVTSGACFPAGSKVEGDICTSATECQSGLLCVGTFSTAVCMYECNPQDPSCPLPGQTCQPLEGGTGVCNPVGGATTTPGGTSPDGSGSTGGNAGSGTTPSGGTATPPSSGGVAPVYVCECDYTTVCDPACACDPECENQSGCLSAAAPLGSSSTGNLWSLMALMGGFLLLRRRRA